MSVNRTQPTLGLICMVGQFIHSLLLVVTRHWQSHQLAAPETGFLNTFSGSYFFLARAQPGIIALKIAGDLVI